MASDQGIDEAANGDDDNGDDRGAPDHAAPDHAAPDHGDEDHGDDEVVELRRERDELAARLSRVERRGARRSRLRGAAVVVLVVVGCVSFTAAAVGVWVRHNVTDTDVWVARAGPLADDPAVRAALGRWLSNEVIDVVDPEALLAEVLPERGRVLSVPLAGAVDGFIRDRIDRFLASDDFEALWVAANEQAHRRLVRILRGDAPNVTAGDESVTINLVPVIDEALARLSASSPEILGRQVDLPDLSVEDLPKDAVTRLGNALGVHLDDDFGQVTVYDEGRLAALQDAADQARRLLVLVAVVAVVSLAGALALSARRRRTLLQILAGLALGIALVRRLGIRAERELVAGIADPVNRDAAAAVTDRFLGPLLDVTRGLLVVLVVAAAVAVLSGPYPPVVRLRARTAAGARHVASTIRSQEIEIPRSTLQVAGVVVGVLALVLLDLSFVGLVVLAALVGLFELVVRPTGGVEAP
jgi:hypothetical protein